MADADTNSKKSDSNESPAVVDTSLNRFIFINLLAYIVNSIITYAVQFGWVDLPSNSELSDKYQTIVTPLGTYFLIWLVIFMWQLFWVIWQFLPSQRNSEGVIKAWYYYPIFTVLQAGWTCSFTFEIMWLALIFMYGLLATLVAASMSLQTYKKTWKGYLIWQFPFSLQTGWIMAASAVMTNVLPVFYEASVTAKIVVSSLSLVVLVVTAFTWLSSYPVDFAIPCVIVFALAGVHEELDPPLDKIVDEFSTQQINGVKYGVLAGAVVIGTGIVAKAVYVLVKQRPQSLKDAESVSTEAKKKVSDSEGGSAEESV